LKTDFTKNHFIIFVIFENFWETFRGISFLGFPGVFCIFPHTEDIAHTYHFVFSHFLSPSLNADLTNLGFRIYCEDPPHFAFNAPQINPINLS